MKLAKSSSFQSRSTKRLKVKYHVGFHGSATTCQVCSCLVEPCWFYCLFCFYSIVAFHIQKVVLFENFCSLPKVWGRRIELLQWEGTSGETVPPTQCESSQLDCARPCPVVFWQSPMMKGRFHNLSGPFYQFGRPHSKLFSWFLTRISQVAACLLPHVTSLRASEKSRLLPSVCWAPKHCAANEREFLCHTLIRLRERHLNL